MPWRVEKSSECPASRPWAVFKEQDGSVEGCHVSEQAAQRQQAALYANEGRNEPIGGAMDETRAEWTIAYINDLPDSAFLYVESGGEKDEGGKTKPRSLRHFPVKNAEGAVDLPHLRNALSRIPQSNVPASVKERLMSKARGMLERVSGRSDLPEIDELVRGAAYGFEIRGSDSGAPILTGRLAVYDEWAEIRSPIEGHFLERIAPGAFTKTITESGDRLKVLFDHGMDPSIGMKPLGKVRHLIEHDNGVDYEVELLDADYVRSLIPGLEAGLYGSSFRFRPIKGKDKTNRWPGRSGHNPKGIPEVTRHEIAMREFGPTTFPSYVGATAGLRSLTDSLYRLPLTFEQLRQALHVPLLDSLLPEDEVGDEEDALRTEGAELSHSSSGRRETSHLYGESQKEKRWQL